MSGDVEWLPGISGGRVLRLHTPPSGPPPALVLQLSGGGEARIDPRDPGEYPIPRGLLWDAAWLVWPDGTRAPIASPHGPNAEIIELHPRRNRTAAAATEAAAEPATSATPEPSVEPAAGVAPESDGGASVESATGVVPESDGGASVESATGAAPESGAGAPVEFAPGAAPEPTVAMPAESASGPAAEATGAPEEAVGGVTERAGQSAPVDGGAAAPAEGAAAWGTWTDLPGAGSAGDPAGEWRERRAELARELAAAHQTLARARDRERDAHEAIIGALHAARADLRAARAAREADAAALAAVTGELEAERAAHAVTRGTVGTLADALATARAELAAAKTRGEATAVELAAARESAAAELAAARKHAEAELAATRADADAAIAEARADAAHARTELASLRDALERDRVAQSTGPVDAATLARQAREQAQAAALAPRRAAGESAALLANLDAAAAALRAAAPVPQADAETPAPASSTSEATTSSAADPAPADDVRSRSGAASGDTSSASGGAASGDASPATGGTSAGGGAASAGAASPDGDGMAAAGGGASAGNASLADDATPLVAGDRRLRRALLTLAREDAESAGAIVVGLLPALGAGIDGPLAYDVTVRGIGTYAVSIADGAARVEAVGAPRGRRAARFHLAAEPATLAELAVGERTRVTRFRRTAKVSGDRRCARDELSALRASKLSLADAVKAGARLAPEHVFKLLPHAVDPEWTRGHSFTIAHEVGERAWHVAARDGARLDVTERAVGEPADATVTLSPETFERLLRDEQPLLGDRPQIRGNRAAVAALKRWTDAARGA